MKPLVTPRHLALALLAVGALAACHKAPPPAAPPPEAKKAAPIRGATTVRAETRKMPRYLRVTGELQAAWDAMVASDVAGKVEMTPVERGSTVKAGDVLVKLDARTAELSLREAEASVALARAQAELSASELKRNEPLAQTRAIASADFSKLKTDSAAKEAQLASAEARRDLAKKSLQDTTILAPFAGTVAERMVAPGEYVRPDTPVARVVDTSTLRLVVNVSESAVGQVRAGQKVEFNVAAYPGESFTGSVKHIGATLRQSTRDLVVEAQVDNAAGRLKPGLFAEARLVLGDADAISVPEKALRVDGARRKLFVVAEAELQERLVEVGESRDGLVEIRRGVAAGESVLLSPPADAADGTPVVAGP